MLCVFLHNFFSAQLMQTMCVCLLADFYMGSSELIKSIYRPSRLPAPDIPAIKDFNNCNQFVHTY